MKVWKFAPHSKFKEKKKTSSMKGLGFPFIGFAVHIGGYSSH